MRSKNDNIKAKLYTPTIVGPEGKSQRKETKRPIITQRDAAMLEIKKILPICFAQTRPIIAGIISEAKTKTTPQIFIDKLITIPIVRYSKKSIMFALSPVVKAVSLSKETKINSLKKIRCNPATKTEAIPKVFISSHVV